MTDRAALDVVIVNWNGGALLRACLASLASVREAASVQVIVVDNASQDGSADALPALPRPLRLIRNAENRGFGRACDQGAAAGDAPAILFLNPDTQVAPDALLVALDALMADPRTGIVGARLVDPDGRTARSCARAPTGLGLLGRALALDRLGLVRPHFLREWDHADDRAVGQVMGAFLMIRRDLFAALDGFDPRFFVYWEDADLCTRARAAGFSVRHVAGAVAHHVGQGTTRQARARRLFYFLRSQILYAGKHHGPAAALALTMASFCAQVPLRLALALARRSPQEAVEVLRAAGLLAAALPGLAPKLLRGR
ncbi:GT2 family glycosyltransferase [Methylobacterium brachiatum]|uniref:GT2 family glycosyltransferase n=1 Tax=Methylobacterium brachiatum TaxID=269660 RepID=A0AAJ1WYP3_9HYPH|nr:glycosyltransferase family 2 protein [Methylobacterium brachiatum]MCB4804504.1 glycosyltransferase family 2 protein [Methylobacterium brachiatum]MDQ0545535.1 GT2 family glycosyltransferase [Methylobacterium brachiatum]